MISEKLDTLISVTDIKIESIYKNSPINFDKLKQTPPSQFLDPVKAYVLAELWDGEQKALKET